MQGRAQVLGVGREGIEQAEERTSQIVWGEGEEFEDKAARQGSVDQGLSFPLGLLSVGEAEVGDAATGEDAVPLTSFPWETEARAFKRSQEEDSCAPQPPSARTDKS